MIWRSAVLLVGVGLVAASSHSQEPMPSRCSLKLRLIDAQSGQGLPGIVEVRDSAGAGLSLPELVNRGQGITPEGPIHRWWCLSEPATLDVPAGPLVVRALAGLESELAEKRIDLSGKSSAELSIPLTRFSQPRRDGYVAGNTHLHLMKLSKQQADRYLEQVPLVDGLDVVFLSYLERAEADLEYTSNKYSPRELARLSHGHLHFGHGQEHRHNFGSHGEGYGHILLLDVPYIVRPVSIGPGISGKGVDAPPLQAGIDEARGAGGKVIWAHNLFGFEDIPNWVTGRVHANNIFDGSARGSYKDSYYRYLNVGLSVPFSTGTDWFIYDFSRAYVLADRAITPRQWLDRLAAGASYITNGPLLEFTVDKQPIGSVIELAKVTEVVVRGQAKGRIDFKRIELVQNGRVVHSSASRSQGDHFVAEMEHRISIEGPAWLALRTLPPPVSDDAELQGAVAQNEFGYPLFSHTSPIYVAFAGRGVFDRDIARGLVAEMQSAVEKINAHAVFDDESQRKHVLGVYQQAIDVLEKRLNP